MAKKPKAKGLVVLPQRLAKRLGWPAIADLESLDRHLCEAWGRAADGARLAREAHNTACAAANCTKAVLARAEAHEADLHEAIQLVRAATEGR